jgi:hypothetical protein
MPRQSSSYAGAGKGGFHQKKMGMKASTKVIWTITNGDFTIMK